VEERGYAGKAGDVRDMDAFGESYEHRCQSRL